MKRSTKICQKGHKKPLNKRCPICYKEYQIKFKKENPDYWKKHGKKWRQDNKVKRDQYEKEYRLYYRVEWLNYFKEKHGEYPQCQICDKVLDWDTRGDHKNRVCFDHRHEGAEVIQKPPRQWVQNKVFSKKNVAIWESCDFGVLCDRCNVCLPTQNRTIFLDRALRYMGYEGIIHKPS